MRGKLVVGNWKMHGGLRQNDALLAESAAGWTAPRGKAGDSRSACHFRTLWQAQAALSGSAIAWGAQDVSEHATGRIHRRGVGGDGRRVRLPLRDCRAIPERRAAVRRRRTTVVAAKAVAALAAGLTPDRVRGRDAGRSARPKSTEAVVLRQLDAVAGPSSARRVGVIGARLRAGVGDRNRQDGDARAEAQAVHR